MKRPSNHTPRSFEPSTFVSSWESLTSLPDDHLSCLAHLTDACKHPYDDGSSRSLSLESTTGDPDDGGSASSPVLHPTARAGFPSAAIDSTQQFYRWFALLEAADSNEENEKYIQHRKFVHQYHTQVSQLKSSVHCALDFLDDLNKLYLLVAETSNSLSEDAESTVVELNYLEAYAENIKHKLSHFSILETISAKFHSTTLSVTDDDFLGHLAKLDECIEFLKKHRHFRAATDYYIKYKQLQNRGLTLVKNYISKQLVACTEAVLQQVADDASASAKRSTYYLSFRAKAPSLRTYVEELEQRSNHTDFRALLTDCHYCFALQRRKLLFPGVLSTLHSLQATKDVAHILRQGATHVIQVCHHEFDLYQEFFATRSPELKNLLDAFAALLYDIVRPIIIRHHDIDTLCTLTDIIKTEIIAEQLQARGDSVQFLTGGFAKMLEDIQERLIFLAQVYFQEHVLNYKPTKDDLDFPGRLLRMRQATSSPTHSDTEVVETASPSSKDNAVAISADGEESSNGGDATTTTTTTTIVDSAKGDDSDAPLVMTEEEDDVGLDSIYRTWYPTLERTLMRLAMLYLSVENGIFEGLAHEAVAVCTASLISASKRIDKAQGPAHSQLFLIRHLVILHEQISPFEIDFAIRETTLDFSSLQAAWGRVMAGERSFFSWSRENAFFDLVSEAAPAVSDTSDDARQKLESLLYVSSDGFIDGQTKSIIPQLLAMVTDMRGAERLAHATAAGGPQTPEEVFKANPAVSPDRVVDVLEGARTNLSEQLPPLIDLIDLYVPPHNDGFDLRDHCRTAILENVESVRTFLVDYNYPVECTNGVAGLVAMVLRLFQKRAADQQRTSMGKVVSTTTTTGGDGEGSSVGDGGVDTKEDGDDEETN